MRNIAIIPARSGSKGVVDKNIKLLAEKPLIVYSIEAALSSGIFDTIHVSTDSEKYAEIGRSYGADIPFLRDEELAGDEVSTPDTVRWVLRKYHELGEDYDNIMILQPTSPLRDGGHIEEAYKLFQRKNADGVISVCECEHLPLWCNTLPDDNNMNAFVKKSVLQPRQKLPHYYRLNGAIYLYKTEFINNTDYLYTDKTYAYIMDAEHSIDIDSAFDFEIAQICMNHLQGKIKDE